MGKEKPVLYIRVGCMSCPAMNEATGLNTRKSRIEYFDEGKKLVNTKIALQRGAWVKENVCLPNCTGDPKTLTSNQIVELNKIGLV